MRDKLSPNVAVSYSHISGSMSASKNDSSAELFQKKETRHVENAEKQPSAKNVTRKPSMGTKMFKQRPIHAEVSNSSYPGTVTDIDNKAYVDKHKAEKRTLQSSSPESFAPTTLAQFERKAETLLTESEQYFIYSSLGQYEKYGDVMALAQRINATLDTPVKLDLLKDLRQFVEVRQRSVFDSLMRYDRMAHPWHDGEARRDHGESSNSPRDVMSTAQTSTLGSARNDIKMLADISQVHFQHKSDEHETAFFNSECQNIEMFQMEFRRSMPLDFKFGGRSEDGLAIYVVEVKRNSAAEKAGLRVGDQIVEVNDMSFESIDFSSATQVIMESPHLKLVVKRTKKITQLLNVNERTFWYDTERQLLLSTVRKTAEKVESNNISGPPYVVRSRSNNVRSLHLAEHSVDGSTGFGFKVCGGSEFGLGIYVSMIDKGGPADKNGVKVGDEIMSISDHQCIGMTHSEAVEIITSSSYLDIVLRYVGCYPVFKDIYEEYSFSRAQQHNFGNDASSYHKLFKIQLHDQYIRRNSFRRDTVNVNLLSSNLDSTNTETIISSPTLHSQDLAESLQVTPGRNRKNAMKFAPDRTGLVDWKNMNLPITNNSDLLHPKFPNAVVNHGPDVPTSNSLNQKPAYKAQLSTTSSNPDDSLPSISSSNGYKHQLLPSVIRTIQKPSSAGFKQSKGFLLTERQSNETRNPHNAAEQLKNKVSDVDFEAISKSSDKNSYQAGVVYNFSQQVPKSARLDSKTTGQDHSDTNVGKDSSMKGTKNIIANPLANRSNASVPVLTDPPLATSYGKNKGRGVVCLPKSNYEYDDGVTSFLRPHSDNWYNRASSSDAESLTANDGICEHQESSGDQAASKAPTYPLFGFGQKIMSRFGVNQSAAMPWHRKQNSDEVLPYNVELHDATGNRDKATGEFRRRLSTQAVDSDSDSDSPSTPRAGEYDVVRLLDNAHFNNGLGISRDVKTSQSKVRDVVTSGIESIEINTSQSDPRAVKMSSILTPGTVPSAFGLHSFSTLRLDLRDGLTSRKNSLDALSLCSDSLGQSYCGSYDFAKVCDVTTSCSSPDVTVSRVDSPDVMESFMSSNDETSTVLAVSGISSADGNTAKLHGVAKTLYDLKKSRKNIRNMRDAGFDNNRYMRLDSTYYPDLMKTGRVNQEVSKQQEDSFEGKGRDAGDNDAGDSDCGFYDVSGAGENNEEERLVRTHASTAHGGRKSIDLLQHVSQRTALKRNIFPQSTHIHTVFFNYWIAAIMDLLSNVNDAHWTSSDPSKVTGLIDYTILKCKPLDGGKFEYALKVNKEDGDMVIGVLEGGQGKRNPLQAARNIELVITGGKIVAVNLDGDCIVKK